MNTIDWESKFNAIVRDTVHNLDKVKVSASQIIGVYCFLLSHTFSLA